MRSKARPKAAAAAAPRRGACACAACRAAPAAPPPAPTASTGKRCTWRWSRRAVHAGPGRRRSAAALPVAPAKLRRPRRLPPRQAAKAGWDGVDRREAKQGRAAAPAKDESIRIDAVKLDALLEVAGESVQAANQAAVLLERLRSSSSKARPPR
jgi:two-component system chemotaxis sensor kinase CheA